MNIEEMLADAIVSGAVRSVQIAASNAEHVREIYDALYAAGGQSVVWSSTAGVRRHSGYVWHSADLTVQLNGTRTNITISTEQVREAAPAVTP